MELRSLGYRTDLMVRTRQGTVVHDRGAHLVARTPSNPSFWWGNFLLVAGPPGPGDLTRWRELFARELPDAAHCAIGVDGVDGETGPAEELEALDLEASVHVVLSAQRCAAPARGAPAGVELRPLEDDDDWRGALALRVLVARDEGEDTDARRDFIERQLAASRALAERSDAWWFGAFEGGELRSALGIVAGDGLARYQAVETHPGHRRRGLAGALIRAAGEHAVREAGASTLVIVAEAGGAAHRLYRSLGFEDRERMVECNGRWNEG
jgi:ribosomal protein S18 acetylase RimI-like enzyme